MDKIAFEMGIIFCHRDLHGSFIRCIKIGDKLPVVLCFQDDKKILLITIIRQLNFVGTLYCNNFFYVKVSLRILSNFIFNLHCLLFIIQNLSCTTSYISTKLFSRMFPAITLEGSHACGEPTK